jgi:hypothetical protein
VSPPQTYLSPKEALGQWLGKLLTFFPLLLVHDPSACIPFFTLPLSEIFLSNEISRVRWFVSDFITLQAALEWGVMPKTPTWIAYSSTAQPYHAMWAL